MKIIEKDLHYTDYKAIQEYLKDIRNIHLTLYHVAYGWRKFSELYHSKFLTVNVDNLIEFVDFLYKYE